MFLFFRYLNLRHDGRASEDLRSIKLTRKFLEAAEGSVLIEVGKTKVLCTASIENSVPRFMRGKNRGWITACLLYTSPSPRDATLSRMPSSA